MSTETTSAPTGAAAERKPTASEMLRDVHGGLAEYEATIVKREAAKAAAQLQSLQDANEALRAQVDRLRAENTDLRKQRATECGAHLSINVPGLRLDTEHANGGHNHVAAALRAE